MGLKISSRQQAQLALLETLQPKFQQWMGIIDELARGKVDENRIRVMARQCDELKVKAAGLSMNAVADNAAFLGQMSRRGGGVQTKVRGMRELLGSLKVSYESALKAATTPEAHADDDE